MGLKYYTSNRYSFCLSYIYNIIVVSLSESCIYDSVGNIWLVVEGVIVEFIRQIYYLEIGITKKILFTSKFFKT